MTRMLLLLSLLLLLLLTTHTVVSGADNTGDDDENEDWATVNEVLGAGVLRFDSAAVGGADDPNALLDVTLSNISCRELQLTDIVVTPDDVSSSSSSSSNINTSAVLELQLVGIETTCETYIVYDSIFLQGEGLLTVRVDDSTLSSVIHVTAPLPQTPATTATVMDCSDGSMIRVTNLTLDNGLDPLILDQLKGFVADIFQSVLCTEISFLMDPTVTELLVNVSESLAVATMIPNTTTTFVIPEPTQGEEEEEEVWLNLQNPQEGFEAIVSVLLDYMSTIFGSSNSNNNMEDENTMNAEEEELGINTFIVDALLDSNQQYVVAAETLFPPVNNNTTDEEEEEGGPLEFTLLGGGFLIRVGEFTNITLGGLNSFSTVQPLVATDASILHMGLTLDQLVVGMDILLDLEALENTTSSSSLGGDEEDEVLVLASLNENVPFQLEWSNIELDMEIFMAVDLNELGSLTLGTLIGSSNTNDEEDDDNGILSCLVDTLAHPLDVASFALRDADSLTTTSPRVLATPVITGFSSPSLDRLLNQILDVVFPTFYQQSLDQVLGRFIQTEGRQLLSDALQDYLLSGDDDLAPCPRTNNGSSGNEPEFLVDFRTLFWSEDEYTTNMKDVDVATSSSRPFADLGLAIQDFLKTPQSASENDSNNNDEPEESLPQVNNVIIDPLTAGLSTSSGVPGLWQFDNVLTIDEELAVSSFRGALQLAVPMVQIENLDTITPSSSLRLLEPVAESAYLLENNFTVGIPTRPLRITTRLSIGLDIEGGRTNNNKESFVPIQNDINVTMEMIGADIDLSMFLQIMTKRLLDFPIQDISNFDCLLAMILPVPLEDDGTNRRAEGVPPSADFFHHFSIDIPNVKLLVECNDCTSESLRNRVYEVNDESSSTVMDSTNIIMDILTQLLEGEFMQYEVDLMLQDAATFCPHREEEYDADAPPRSISRQSLASGLDVETNTDDISFLLALALSLIAVLLVLLVIRVAVRCFVKRRHRTYLRSLPAEKVQRIYHLQQLVKERDGRLNEATKSLFQTDEIPLVARYLIPVVVLGNIGLFLSGHLNVGGSIAIFGNFDGQAVEITDFFDFAIARTTVQLWNAGGRELAALIFITSIIWPYTRMLLTLFLWFVPPQWMSVSRRGTCIMVLDNLAKWSTIDIFVLVISLVSFRLSFDNPDYNFFPDNFYSIDLILVLQWGIYANLLAQLVSQITSHFIIHFHRSIVDGALLKEEEHTNNKAAGGQPHSLLKSGSMQANHGSGELLKFVDSLSEDFKDDDAPDLKRLKDHAFTRPHRGEDDTLVVRGWVKALAPTAVAVLLAGLLVTGCIFPVLSLEYFGLLGLAVEASDNFEREAINDYSIFQIAELLMNQATFLGEAKDIIGMLSIIIVFLLTVLIVPFLQTSVLLLQWIRPLSRNARRRWVVILEILAAWQYVEVFVIALVVSAWQLGPVSEYLLNDYCTSFDDALAQFAYYGLIQEVDAQCFRISATIKYAAFFLIGVAFLLSLLNSFVLQAVKQLEREEQWKEEEHWHEQHLRDADVPFLDEVEYSEDLIDKIDHPSPALFTDSFRWLLVPTGRVKASPVVATRETTMEEKSSSPEFVGGDDDQLLQRTNTSASEPLDNVESTSPTRSTDVVNMISGEHFMDTPVVARREQMASAVPAGEAPAADMAAGVMMVAGVGAAASSAVVIAKSSSHQTGDEPSEEDKQVQEQSISNNFTSAAVVKSERQSGKDILTVSDEMDHQDKTSSNVATNHKAIPTFDDQTPSLSVQEEETKSKRTSGIVPPKASSSFASPTAAAANGEGEPPRKEARVSGIPAPSTPSSSSLRNAAAPDEQSNHDDGLDDNYEV